MKKFFIVLLLLILSAIGGYYIYQKEFKQKTGISNLIPLDALFIYSSSNIIEDYSLFSQTKLADNLQKYNWYKNVSNEFKILHNQFKNNPLSCFLSVHKSSKNELTQLYYFNSKDKNELEELLNIYTEKNKYRIDNRSLDGKSIVEVVDKNKTVLCYTLIDDWIIVSKSPFFIERIIKNLNSKINYSLHDKVLTVNQAELNKYVSSFFNNKFTNHFLNFEDEILNFSLSEKGEFYMMNGAGKSAGTTSNGEFINLIECANYISMNTAIVTQKEGLIKGLIGNSFFWISKNDHILENVVDTLFVNDIKSIYVVSKLLKTGSVKPLFGIKVDNYLIASASKSLLNEIMNDIDNENVWSKSIKIRNQLSNTAEGTSTSLLINWGKASEYISANAKIESSTFQNSMNWIDFIVYESSVSNDNCIVEVFMSIKKDEDRPTEITDNTESETEQVKSELVYEHKNEIITQPFIVRNHKSGSRELLFQDSEFNICLMGSTRKLLWKTNVKSKIKSKIHQVDIFRNGKLQYAFCTESELIVLDRKGNFVDNYPINIDGSITHFSLFDYSNDRNYRFLVSVTNGDLFLFNSKGEMLDPWNPISLKSSVIQAFKHIRVKTKDYIVAVTKDEKVHLFNRRGEYYKGFPINLGLSNTEKFTVDIKDNSSKSGITIYSADGKKASVNFRGEILSKAIEIEDGNKLSFYPNTAFISYLNNQKIVIANSLNNTKFEIEYLPERLSTVQLTPTKQLVIVSVAGFSELYSGKGELVTSFNSTSEESYIYSEAKEELTFYITNNKKIKKVKIAY